MSNDSKNIFSKSICFIKNTLQKEFNLQLLLSLKISGFSHDVLFTFFKMIPVCWFRCPQSSNIPIEILVWRQLSLFRYAWKVITELRKSCRCRTATCIVFEKDPCFSLPSAYWKLCDRAVFYHLLIFECCQILVSLTRQCDLQPVKLLQTIIPHHQRYDQSFSVFLVGDHKKKNASMSRLNWFLFICIISCRSKWFEDHLTFYVFIYFFATFIQTWFWLS